MLKRPDVSGTGIGGPARSNWARQRERGRAFPLRLMMVLSLRAGWWVGSALLYPITLYFYLTSPRARAASRDYLSRVLGHQARAGDVFRHFLTFSAVILDRVFLLSGRDDAFDITIEGLEVLLPHLERGTGCLLVGAHIGSFDVLRAVGRRAPVRARPLMYREHGSALTVLLEALDPELAGAIIEIGRPETMLRVQDALREGEMVGLLADRTPDQTRRIRLPFLGSPADFPAGPWMLAGVLDVPVVLFYGVRTGPRRYLVRFERFADRVKPGRATRSQDLQAVAGRYVASLEAACRAWPFNWFNFYPFWSEASPRDDR